MVCIVEQRLKGSAVDGRLSSFLFVVEQCGCRLVFCLFVACIAFGIRLKMEVCP